MGRYYPPDAENAPRFNTSHPLGHRAKGINQGILTVRFELPFAVWCDHCNPPAIVGQGVRFNAEKKKAGNYYSTPIWSFRMKHTACGGWWEILTDPKNAEYVVVEGARRRDYGKPEQGEGELAFLTEEERERRRNDAFANLEGKMDEKGKETKQRDRIEELYEAAEVWRDPYEVNARLRKDFRAQRKLLEKEEKYKEGMQDKFSLGLEIADETDTDRVRASLIDFEDVDTSDRRVDEVVRRPLFESRETNKAAESGAKVKKLKSEVRAEQSRQRLQQTLVSNTRAAIDPFLSKGPSTKSKLNLGILKRKRDAGLLAEPDISATANTAASEESTSAPKKPALSAALVNYDSD